MTINSQLLDALSADVRIGGKYLPCGILRLILDGQSYSRFQPDLVDQALLLLAVYRKLLKALEKDLADRDVPYSETKKPWKNTPKLDMYTDTVPANKIKFKEIPIPYALILVNVENFLRSLPLNFVRDLIKWAPPVIAQDPQKKQPHLVFENLLSAFIASHLLADKLIKVKVLTQYPVPCFTLHDLLQTLKPLDDLYKDHKNRIILQAPDPKLAVLITDIKPAQVYRLRQSENVRE